MIKQIKMIAADLDRTLLKDDETLSAETIEAIRRTKEKGYLFVVATARSLYSTMLVARDLCPDAIIHSQGGSPCGVRKQRRRWGGHFSVSTF